MTERTPETLMRAMADVADELGVDPDAPTAVRVHIDPAWGHMVIVGDDGRLVALADLGTVLHLWSSQGMMISPAGARELGSALVAWADRKDGRP